MSDSTQSDVMAIGAPAAAEGVAVDRGAGATRQEVRRLAQEFEALLLTKMLRDMRRSMVDDESSSEAGFGAMTDTMDIEFGRALSAAGGFGLSGALMDALNRLVPSDATARTVVAGRPSADSAGLDRSALSDRVPAGLTVHESTATASAKAPAGHVTSGFGWRRDPFSGAPGFHKGVDIAMAYGQDVPAVAPGQVVFAGENGSYGNTVTLRHPDGHQTRYAHLSEHYVQTGEMVETGRVLGKSGSSGRSTGPHLHFEVLVDGRPVDPTALDQKRQPGNGDLAGSWPAAKGSLGIAD